MSKRSSSTLTEASPAKKVKLSPPANDTSTSQWADWPAPRSAMSTARKFIADIVDNRRSVLIVPDKDADGLSAGTLLYRTLVGRGLPAEKIMAHHLGKGNSVHSDIELNRMRSYGAERAVILDQGSRPGTTLIPDTPTLIIDHHMSNELWPEHSFVLTACHSPPIATTSLLTYCLLKDPAYEQESLDDWLAVVGVYGDLGTKAAQWGTPPWPAELKTTVSRWGGKNLSDAVSAINAPRRTAEYNVPRAWQILLDAEHPSDVANNAFLRLCKLDVASETQKWARQAPKFSQDGRVAMIEISSGFQIHPVIATRWAGTLGRKSDKLIMVMCANTGYNPDPDRVSFSCRVPSTKRNVPNGTGPNLIELLKAYGNSINGFNEAVGADFARGHTEATGGIIPANEFRRLVDAMEIGRPRTKASRKSTPADNRSIGDFFKPVEQTG